MNTGYIIGYNSTNIEYNKIIKYPRGKISVEKYAILLVLLFYGNICQGAEMHNYTIGDIIAALKVAESQASALKFDYFEEEAREYNEDGSVKTRIYINATFARDSTKGCIYQNYLIATLKNMDTGITQNNPGRLVAFDGENTVNLDRNLDHGQMRATIQPGRADELLKLPGNPHFYYIRGYSGRLYSEWLTSNGSEFKIVDSENLSDGTSTVKIEGTIGNGRILVSLWLCPERSFLPVKFLAKRTDQNVISIEYHLSKFEKLSDGSYYPKDIEFINSAGMWKKIEISNICTDLLPDEFFRPKMPPNTHVTDHILKVSYVTTDADDLGLKEIDSFASDINIQQNPDIAQEAIEEYVNEAEIQRQENSEITSNQLLGQVVENSASRKSYFVFTVVSIIVIVVAGVIILKLKSRI